MASIKKRPTASGAPATATTPARSTPGTSTARSTRSAGSTSRPSKLVTGTHVAPRAGADDRGGVVRHLARGLPRQPRVDRPAGRGAHRPDQGRRSATCGSGAVRPSHVRTWCCPARGRGAGRLLRLRAARAARRSSTPTRCTTGSSPSRRARGAPRRGQGKQRPYVATTEQVWALHDAMPEHLRAAVLLGAFAGLRLAEACGLRVVDVDFMRGVVSPAVQYPAEPLKTETSQTPVPIPQSLALDALRARRPLAGRDGARQRARAGSSRPGPSSGPSARPGPRCPASRRSSGSTTCGTTSPRC